MERGLPVEWSASENLAWKVKLPGAGASTPILFGGRIYYFSRDGRVFVVAAQPEFEQLAVNFLGDEGTFNSGFAIGGGRMYLRNDQYLHCLGRE